MKNNQNLLRITFMGMMIALGVVISPILRVEGMCPMAHLINVTCAVFIGPYYAFLCALIIGILRMIFMGIPPLALTGAVFGAFLSGMLYRLSKGKIVWAFLGEVIGTGIIGAIVSYPVMTWIWGRTGLTWMFYVPSFTAGTLIGGSLAFVLLTRMKKAGLVAQIQAALGSDVYTGGNEVLNDAIYERNLPVIQQAIAQRAGAIPSYWLVVAMLAYLLYYALVGCKNVNKDIPVD